MSCLTSAGKVKQKRLWSEFKTGNSYIAKLIWALNQRKCFRYCEANFTNFRTFEILQKKKKKAFYLPFLLRYFKVHIQYINVNMAVLNLKASKPVTKGLFLSVMIDVKISTKLFLMRKIYLFYLCVCVCVFVDNSLTLKSPV